ncbi:cobalamin-binding protein [Alkalibaculum sp. M08DMB]|uniref:Cobalamin-binding protein n=1 Tax=Alkalibaculum sporogenes TaxID=2655001 RepID=A0A6A7K9Z0_9FIRM|nr:cobalamin-dependent protein [Alkalibaculum sporogenes]MPW26290.1 cobalamin-binding protein [Alkalibaculum sporogenes]
MILEDITSALGELDEELLFRLINEYLSSDPSEEKANKIISYCQEGTKIVGERYHMGEYFVGDLIFAGELLTEVIDMVKPYLIHESSEYIGKILLGTVHGDLHDIGKNIFKSMCEAAGFKVYDIGIDQKESTFVQKVREIKPDIVGMSGILTVAIEAMKETVDALKEAGLRDNLKIIIGGNPVNIEASNYIGADAFSVNSNEGVNICIDWMKEKKQIKDPSKNVEI